MKSTLGFTHKVQVARSLEIDVEWIDRICEGKSDLFHKKDVLRKDKKRTVYDAKHPLKTVLKRLNRKLMTLHLSPRNCFFGGMPRKSIIDNARRHVGKRFVMNMDLKAFFPSIKPPMIAKVFRRLGCTEKMSALLTYIVTAENHLPQGYSTSTILSAHVLTPLAEDLKQLLTSHGFRFTFWVDDLTISGDKDPSFLKKPIGELCKKHGFKLKHEKTRVGKPGDKLEVTGIFINDGVLRPSSRYVSELEKAIHLRSRYGWQLPNALLSLECNAEAEFVQKMRGRIDFLRPFNVTKAQQLLQRL